MLTLALLLLSVVPVDLTVRESVDLLELNHFFDDNGRLVFDQLIFWDWHERAALDTRFTLWQSQFGTSPHITKSNGDDPITPFEVKDEQVEYGPRFQVRAWRLVKHPNQIPLPDHRNGGYSVLWHDGETERCIHAKSFRETWTQVGIGGDPELVEREYLPKEKRKELRTTVRRRLKNSK
jgi:hypothetical protein